MELKNKEIEKGHSLFGWPLFYLQALAKQQFFY